jgi:mono/diheme cytochrome c family protein
MPDRRLLTAHRTATVVILALMRTALAQDQAKVEAGEQIYNTYCSTCHGDNLVSSGQIFDLRRLTASDRSRFANSVLMGKNQMPPWKGMLGEEQIDALWQYIRANATQK